MDLVTGPGAFKPGGEPLGSHLDGHLDGDEHVSAGLAGDAVLNQAKGVLMLRYGIGSHQALALLLQWSRETDTDLRTVVTTLLDEIHKGSSDHSDSSDLAQWLDEALRKVLPGEWS